MLKTTITYRKDPGVAAKKLKAIVAEALAWVIKYRHGRVLKKHFQASAAGRYHYKRRSYKYVQRKERKFGHRDPLVFTGDMKRQVLQRIALRAIKGKGAATGRMKGPRYLHMGGRGKSTGPPMGDELNRDTKAELKTMGDLFHRRSAKALDALKGNRTVKIG